MVLGLVGVQSLVEGLQLLRIVISRGGSSIQIDVPTDVSAPVKRLAIET